MIVRRLLPEGDGETPRDRLSSVVIGCHVPSDLKGTGDPHVLQHGNDSPARALQLHSLIAFTEQGIASRVLAKTSGGNLTLFALDAGQGLAEHTSPFDALVLVLEGALALTIGGTTVQATPGTIVRMPADVAHAVEAPEATRMLLIMLRDHGAGA